MSACCFIRDNDVGAFCLWESMAQLIPLVDDYVIYDFGSTDGTLDTLKYLAGKNRKIRVVEGPFPINPLTGKHDAGSFAVLANDVISICENDLVIYHQADEIWHENLLELMMRQLAHEVEEENHDFDGLSFWRVQLKENFQRIKWFPHMVKRLLWKHDVTEKSNPFVDDGMNPKRQAEVCGHFDGGWGQRWDPVYKPAPWTLPTHEMILDVSRNGGFLENIVKKSTLHGPFWNENPNVEGRPVEDWHREQLQNPNWTRETTPFEIPEIMRAHLGETTYHAREEILLKVQNG